MGDFGRGLTRWNLDFFGTWDTVLDENIVFWGEEFLACNNNTGQMLSRGWTKVLHRAEWGIGRGNCWVKIHGSGMPHSAPERD